LQEQAFDAAVRLITTGPGDQPLMRLLSIAMEMSGCSAAMIVARRPDGHQVVVSKGIPLTQFREMLPPTSAISTLFAKPVVIEDATQISAFENSQLVHGPAAWRYMANVPLPLNLLPFPVTLTCADHAVGVDRPENLLFEIEKCAAIAADEIRMIGDIASQSEAVRSNLADIAMLSAAVNQAQMPMAVLDDSLAICAISPRLAAMFEKPTEALLGEVFSTDYLGRADGSEQKLFAVLQTNEPLIALHLSAPDGRHVSILDAFCCETQDKHRRFLIVTVTDRSATFQRFDDLVSHHAESPGVVSSFLLTTLIRQKKLLKRGRISFHSTAKWRANVKDTQIAALRAIKTDPPQAFLAAVADEMASAASALFGSQTFKAVVPVPCGSSGPNCLSYRLAKLVAARLGVEFFDAFEPLPQLGSSHPKQNKRRPKMRLLKAPKVPVLLIDDVATSGEHIEEAATLLLQSAPAVLPLAWISG
jgi:PAS domain-containing protein